jgi:D-alanyl-D-alanine carboxypeptidase
MMEAATGQSWEDMMRERIFGPLGMRTADFGWPGANTQDDGFLWGHEARGDVIIPVDPDGDYQLPRVLAPAGDVHASLGDMARFASAYLRALQGSESIIKGETIRTMYRPRIKSGLGWGVQAAFGFDSVAVYSGSADTYFFVIAVIPEANRTIVAASNAADDEAQQATIELLKLLAAEYTSKNR